MTTRLIGREWTRRYLVPFSYDFEGKPARARIPRWERWGVALEWKPQDLWIGAFVRLGDFDDGRHRDIEVWVCLLPMLPIHVWWQGRLWPHQPGAVRQERQEREAGR